MVGPAIRWLVGAVGGVAAAAAVATLAVAWRLSLGPISVEFLTPALEEWLSETHQGFDLRVGRSSLEWAGWDRSVTVRFEDAQVVDANDGLVALIPAASATLSVSGLLSGVFAPVEISVYRPSLTVRRSPAGLELRMAEGSDGSAALLRRALDAIMAPPARGDAMSRLEEVRIVDADLTIEDTLTGTRWQAPVSEARLWRQDGGIDGELVVDVLSQGGRGELVVVGRYRPDADRWKVVVGFGGVRPDAFAGISPAFSILRAADAPLRGTVTLAGAARFLDTVSSVAFDLTAGAGRLVLPDDIAAGLGGEVTLAPVALEWLSARGRYRSDDERIVIDHLEARFPADAAVRLGGAFALEAPIAAVVGRGSVALPAREIAWDDLEVDLGPAGLVVAPALSAEPLPLRSLAASGRLDLEARRLDLGGLTADLHGPSLSAAGMASAAPDGAGALFDVALGGIPIDSIGLYWPPEFQPGARRWVIERLSAGVLETVQARVALSAAGDDLRLDSLAGSMRLAAVDIRYMPTLPPVRGADATAVIAADGIAFTVTSGAADGVSITGATVDLTGLGSDTETAVIDVSARGSIPDVLRLIDHPPLRYAEAVGIDPAKTAGRADVRLELRLPLVDALRLDQIEVAAEADLEGAEIVDAVHGKDLHAGDVALRLDASGYDLRGVAALEGVTGALVGRENFGSRAPFRRRLHIDVRAADLGDVQKLFFAERKVPDDLLHGTVSADIVLTQVSKHRGSIEGRLDFADAYAAAPYFGWTKTRGAAARAEIRGTFENAVLHEIPRFSVAATGLALDGSARFDREGRLQRVDLARVAAGRTDANGAVVRRPDDAWEVAVGGSSLDLAPLLGRLEAGADSGLAAADPGDGTAVSLDVGTVWLAGDRRLSDVSGSAARAGGAWSSVMVQGHVDDGSRFDVRIRPGASGERVLTASAENAGSTLRTFGLFSTMTGGRLSVQGRFDDSRPSRPLVGELTVTDYRLRDAPVLARMLGMLALPEIDNTLRGEGLRFDVLKAPFTLDDRFLTIDGAQATGVALGVTASGTIDLADETVDLRGSLAPMYAVNGFLGRLPVIGALFNGGETGGGMFAATYAMTGTLDDADVMVNPLAALAPGMLRQVFNVFDRAPAADADALPLETAGERDEDR